MATVQEIAVLVRAADEHKSRSLDDSNSESFEHELGCLSVDGASSCSVSSRHSTKRELFHDEKDLELQKALPPIKTRREAKLGDPEAPDLSPPPSPKRMRELVRKTSLKNLAFPAIRTPDST